MKIFNLSPYVKNQFKQNPHLYDLVENKLDLQSNWINFQDKNPHLDMFALPRKYRQTRLALIAAQDSLTLNPHDHIHTLNQTSQLAKLLITYAYQKALNEMQQKCGNVLNVNNDKQSLIIFALGKLGGNELNYSSDVDLVFCYTDNGQSDGKKCLDAQSYFNRLGRRIIQILDGITTNGIVYRVDMRLRPFGSAAPLTCSMHNLLSYLEHEGRDWERYAWLRASFIAGDKDLANETLKQIEPFIYRKYLDYSIFESLRQIKAQIQRQQFDDEDNLKLGYGGIREIEFIVQTLQITFGGRNKLLRGNDLWQQMHRLCEFKHISVKDLQQLTSAWLFLRKLENLCQIIHDRDSHHLPEETEALAVCMGLKNSEELTQQLQAHKDNVHAIFQQLFVSNKVKNKNEITHPQIQQIKDEISARNYPKTIKHKIYSALDAITGLLPEFDNQDEIIKRYKQVINAISKRQSYLSMLVESPLVLQKLITQISHSGYFSNCIAKTPSLLEVLFDKFDEHDFDVEQQWQIFSKMHDVTDTEEQLELLAQFKQRIQFKAIMAYIDELHNTLQTCGILTLLAEFILSQVIKLSWQETQQKIPSTIQTDDLIVIAYGSLAMKTMHLNSDFDLVFVLASDINDNNHKFVMRWIKCIINYLSIQNYSGSLYQLDTQLRPNGNSGTAIVSRSNFENYQINHAWTWEHAALIKTRAVYATSSQKQWLNNFRTNILTQKRDADKVMKDLAQMAKKMKQLGKQHDSEFILLGKILTEQNKDSHYLNLLHDSTKKLDRILKNSIN